jgi:hypothetical protein
MESLFKTLILLNGESAPYTGAWMNCVSSRDMLFSVYGSGNGSIVLQYKNPFGFINENEGVPFYTFSNIATGYTTPAFSTSPMNEVRAISSGNGQFWTSATIQN